MLQDNACLSFVDNKKVPSHFFPYTGLFFACLKKKWNENHQDLSMLLLL